VIPCYNEAKRLRPGAFLDMLAKEPALHFLFVNDGSTDNTPTLLQSMRSNAVGKVSVLEMEKNSGKAEAVRCGMLKAMEQGCDNVGYWDADLAAPLSAIADLCGVLDS